MRLLIDTRNGIAGDIVAAGLIGLGADRDRMISSMVRAGSDLGQATVSHSSVDGVGSLDIDIRDRMRHLHGSRAYELLDAILEELEISPPYADMARNVLRTLTKAEGYVHSHDTRLMGNFHGPGVTLHEAMDILVDVTAMAVGLESLDITSVSYIDHVNVGGGTITFSHGSFNIPTPATERILSSHGIPWERSDLTEEAATPTGVSILAGCGAVLLREPGEVMCTALATGTRDLPPIAFHLASGRAP